MAGFTIRERKPDSEKITIRNKKDLAKWNRKRRRVCIQYIAGIVFNRVSKKASDGSPERGRSNENPQMIEKLLDVDIRTKY